MDVEIIGEMENPLMHRKEYRMRVSGYGPTPGRKEISAAIASKLGADEANVAIKTVGQESGLKQADCVVHVYEKGFREKTEPAYIAQRPDSPKREPKKKGGKK